MLKRLRDWFLQTLLGRGIAIVGPIIVSVLTAYFLNRLSSFEYTRTLQSWEFYVIVGLVVLTVGAAIAEQAFRATAERRRQEVVGTAEIHATRNFTGRGDQLAEIDTALERDALAVVICGSPGVGKSTLAREYAYRHRKRFSVLWWLNANSEQGIIDGLTTLGAFLSEPLDATGDAYADALRVLRNLAELQKPALLIFDGLESEVVLFRYKPATGVRVLATSAKASATWSCDIAAVALGVWSNDEGVQYLLAESKSEGMTRADAVEISRALSFLPLALSHAAAYFRETRAATVETYLANLSKHLAEVPPGADYPRSVLATLKESLERAESEAPGAAAILCLASFFAPAAIPVELFQQSPDVYPGGLVPALMIADTALDLRSAVSDRTTLEEALGTLDRLCLVVFFPAAQVITTHELVQLAAGALIVRERYRWAHAAVEAVEDVFPDEASDEAVTRNVYLRWLPHALAALEAVGQDTNFAPAGWLAAHCAEVLHQNADFGGAETLYRRALAIFEVAYGQGHVSVATVLKKMAALLQETARSREAELAYRRAIDIDEAHYDVDDPEVAYDLNGLALVLEESDPPEAEKLFRRAIALYEAAYGPDAPQVADCLDNLGNLLHEDKRLDEAESLHRRALAINAAVFGIDHSKVAGSLLNLGTVIHTTKGPAAASSIYRKALAIYETHLGPSHPSVALALNNLGRTLRERGKSSEAAELHSRALAIDEAAYGRWHPKVARDLGAIAEAFEVSVRLWDAAELYQRAILITEKNFGSHHYEVGRLLHQRGAVLAKSNQRDEAERSFRLSLQITEAALGFQHPELWPTIFSLAELLRGRDRAQAELLHRRALVISESAYGPGDRRTIESRHAISRLDRQNTY
jgi:tetratricopeptide (TPR) repeat protein